MSPEETLFEYLRDIIYEEDAGEIDADSLPEGYCDLGKGLLQLSIWMKETKAFAAALAAGNLDVEPPSRENPIAGDLKALQATMNHIAWQAGQVTMGDYTQRIDFMGDLSNAFNEMTEQLKVKTRELEMSRDSAIQSRDQYKEVAFVDDMTGLHNRHYIMPVLERYIEKGIHFCLTFIDLDQLKLANDIYGHSEGDRYIREAAKVIDALPVEKEAARVGGDEFLLITQGVREQELTNLLEETRQKLRNHHNGKAFYIRSFSYGVVEVPPGTTSSRNKILRDADLKMYSYKQSKRTEPANPDSQSRQVP